MTLHANKPRYMRRKSDVEAWEKTIDALAMSICPAEEWQAYERQIQQVAWKTQAKQNGLKPGRSNHALASVRVFPVWKKYREKALRVATLHQAVPLFRHLPLSVSCFLGEVLFK